MTSGDVASTIHQSLAGGAMFAISQSNCPNDDLGVECGVLGGVPGQGGYREQALTRILVAPKLAY